MELMRKQILNISRYNAHQAAKENNPSNLRWKNQPADRKDFVHRGKNGDESQISNHEKAGSKIYKPGHCHLFQNPSYRVIPIVSFG
jgi:hypothetical protein